MSGGRSASDRVRAAIAREDHDGAIAYLDERPYGPGKPLIVDRKPVEIAAFSRVAFVDLEPAANWAHRACFVVLPDDTDTAHVLPARFPPFRGDDAAHFALLWRGPDAPEWAIAVTRPAR